MTCLTCQSQAIAAFPAEVRFYMNGSRTLSAPPMSPNPPINVCLNCGNSWFTVPPSFLASGWLRPIGVPFGGMAMQGRE